MKKYMIILLIFVLLVIITGCSSTVESKKVSGNNETMILSTTTSTRDTGLLNHIIPDFTKKTGIEVKIIAVGTGKALQMGRDGEADALLVHAKDEEKKFIDEGYGVDRKDVMYNDFILVGPKGDPLELKEDYPNDIYKALDLIAENQLTFVSRGDDSGTHKKELKLWDKIDITPKGDWYISNGSGMGDTLKMTDEKQGYTITDRGTYLSMKAVLELEMLVENREVLLNQYGVIRVNPDKNSNINGEAAEKFMDWFISDETQEMIGEFGEDEYGISLFIPNGNK